MKNIKNSASRRKEVLKLGNKKSSRSFLLICKILKTDSSPVIRHEAAFILGTTKNRKAASVLIDSIFTDKSDLVRHECIEALGDLGTKSRKVINTLNALRKDKNPFIRDTAQIALETLNL